MSMVKFSKFDKIGDNKVTGLMGLHIDTAALKGNF